MRRPGAAIGRACRGAGRALAFVGCALAGCGYQPGSFTAPQHTFAGQRGTVGCFDVAVERRPDLPIGPVLGYQFANRCDHAATIDLGAIAVVGRDAAGTETALAPYDPRAELHPVALDARNVGGEALAYPAAGPVSQLCVDLATLVHQVPSRWSCFAAAAATALGSVP